MPDITMCRNNSCVLKEKCYRYTAKPNPERQAYNLFTGPTIYEPDKKCEYYYPVLTDKKNI